MRSARFNFHLEFQQLVLVPAHVGAYKVVFVLQGLVVAQTCQPIPLHLFVVYGVI
jgi:hypothetical protein